MAQKPGTEQKRDQKPKRRFRLVRAFAKAVVLTFALCSTAYAGWFGANYAGRGEPLNMNERQAAVEVFGGDINTSAVRKHFREVSSPTHFKANTAGMVLPPFSHIDFFDAPNQTADYTLGSRWQYELFMHEMTHVWQGQHMRFPLHDLTRYDYVLTPTSRFEQYGPEQQADLVAHYARRWLHPDNPNAPHDEQDMMLRRVVENKFPNAQVTRLRLEREREQQKDREQHKSAPALLRAELKVAPKPNAPKIS